MKLLFHHLRVIQYDRSNRARTGHRGRYKRSGFTSSSPIVLFQVRPASDQLCDLQLNKSIVVSEDYTSSNPHAPVLLDPRFCVVVYSKCS